METKQIFKYVFFILWGIIAVLVAWLFGYLITERMIPFVELLPITIGFILAIGVSIGISVLVYKDALKREMDPWLWATIAAFLPNLLGVILYILVRNTGKRKCVKCNRILKDDFILCPYCGQSQDLKCAGCGKKVVSDWKVCPFCQKAVEA